MGVLESYFKNLKNLDYRKSFMKGLSDYIGMITRIGFLVIIINFVEKNWVWNNNENFTTVFLHYAGIVFLCFMYALAVLAFFTLMIVTTGNFTALMDTLRRPGRKIYNFLMVTVVIVVGSSIITSVFFVLLATLGTMGMGERGLEILRDLKNGQSDHVNHSPVKGID